MSQFAHHTRSQAFHLTMTHDAIIQLLNLEVYSSPLDSPCGRPDWFLPEYGVTIATRSVTNYLLRRGLIKPATAAGCHNNWMLTAEGLLLCPLLRAAGFTASVKRTKRGRSRPAVELCQN